MSSESCVFVKSCHFVNMVDCLKSYCKSCSFQNLQKAGRCTKSVSNRAFLLPCTTIHRYPMFSMRYSVMCKVYTGYCGTSEIEHGLWACTVDKPRAKARGLSLRTGTQTMLYLLLVPQFTDNQCLARDTP